MRILLVSKEFAPFTGWGAGTYAALAARALADAGHDVHVLTDLHDGLGDNVTRDGLTFHAVHASQGFAALRSYACSAQQHAYAVYERCTQLHATQPYDYIEFPDFLGEAYFVTQARVATGAFANAVLGIRLHMTMRHIHQLDNEDWFDLARCLIEHQEERSLLQADLLLAPCASMLQQAQQVFPALGRALAHQATHSHADPLAGPLARVVHLPVPLAQQQAQLGQTPATIAARAAMDADDALQTANPIVLYAGRYERRKGVHTLVRAALQLLTSADPLLARTHIHLVGEDMHTGPLGTSMQAYLLSLVPEGLRDRFHFLPRVQRSDIARMYSGCTVACLPSIWENFPFACQEALLLGTPFVGSAQGGMSDIIEDEVSGLLTLGGESDASATDLAHRLARFIREPALRRACSAAGPARIAHVCDPSRIARETTQAIEAARARQRAATTAHVVASPTAPTAPSAPIELSIIIPLYNTHEFVEDTLRSLREQTLLRELPPRSVEVLLVDDGSTNPATIAALDRLQASAPREQAFVFRVLREPHRGLSGTRNAGLRAAQGRFVMPVDSDDMLEATTLSKLRAALLRNPSAAYSTAYLRHFRDDPQHPVGGWIALGNDPDLLPVINAGSNAAMMMPRELLLRAKGYDESLPAYEDWDLCCTFAGLSLRGVVVPEFLILYRLRDSSMMHGIDRIKHERLRARLLSKHPHLSSNPGRTLRLLLGDTVDMGQLLHARGQSATAMVEDKRLYEAATMLLHENLRYRLADRLNNAAKKLGVQRAVKNLVRKVQR
jgi:glycosyltransferase involved in cell wall biosynthesis